MKKRISVLIAIVLVIAVALPVLASCETPNKTVSSISVVSPKTEYKVDEAIDYDSLKIEVKYDDGTTEIKTVKELKASVTKADLSKSGNTSYTVIYGGKSATVNIKVTAEVVEPTKVQLQTFVEPSFYTEYTTKSADRGDKEETRSDFRITEQTYEVGNANKFIFRPSATGLDIEAQKTVTISNVKTTAKVYSKDAQNGTYTEVAADALADFVTIEDNTYLFSEQAAGKYIKLEITLDSEEYDVDLMEEELRTITVEFVVVDGGYNVYNQLGLSVMCDLQKQAWSQLWGATATYNADTQKYDLTAGANPVKLESDTDYLYTYVGNVKWVILHGDLTLDAEQMPAQYFWDSKDPSYNTALESIKGLTNLESKLNGSLKDGLNNGQSVNYTKDTIPGSDHVVAETGISANMQNGLFATNKVSVSGNYHSIIVPEYKEGGRHFYTVVDYDNASDSKPAYPVSHWSVFQIHMKNDASGLEAKYNFKNLSMSGNNAKDDVAPDEKAKGIPAGMMMVNCYSNGLTFDNIVSEKFYTNVIVDGYGDITRVDILNSKFYDSYSNMCYMRRSKVFIENSELIGAGGPLFILCDGARNIAENRGDDNGPNMTVDKKSVLQSYATGNESWYVNFDAQALIGQLSGALEKQVLNKLGKTILTKQNGLDYVNVIAAMICDPAKIIAGQSEYLIDVCGRYTTMDGETVVEQFAMHNQVLTTLRESTRVVDGKYHATQFPAIIQVGNLYAFTDMTNLYTLGASGAQPFNPATDGVAWATNTNDKICVYMSAASQSKSDNAPYFGAILDVAPFQAQ